MSLDDTLEQRAPAAATDPPLAGWTELYEGVAVTCQPRAPIVAALDTLYAYGGIDGPDMLDAMAPDGTDWERIAGDWSPPRQYPAGTAWQGQLWLVGGQNQGDTWVSGDNPKSWNRLEQAGAWGPRFGHTVIGFGDHLYLMAGVTGGNLQGDVWRKLEAPGWAQLKAAAFPPRMSAAGAVLGGRMVLLGGQSAGGPLAEALVSADGVTWTRQPAPWPGRYGAQAVVLDEVLYLVGGVGADGGSLRDVWATPDAVVWTKLDEAAPWQSLTEFGAGPLGGRAVVLGGVLDGSPNPKVWGYKPSGWLKVAQVAAMSGQRQVVSVQAPQGIWCLQNGGAGVLSSADGVSWTPRQTNLPSRPRSAATAHGGALWLSGGLNAGEPTNEVWRSTDGTTWTQAPAGPRFTPRSQHVMASFAGKLWVIGGWDAGAISDVWSSVDGASWTREGDGFPYGIFLAASAVFEGRLWIIGSPNNRADAFVSDDGVRWTAHDMPWEAGRFSPEAQVVGDTLYALGGFEGSASRVKTDVWAYRTATGWRKAADPGPWTTGSGFGSAVVDGAILVFGGQDAAGHGSPDIYRFRPPPA